jgi:hypothetical protein
MGFVDREIVALLGGHTLGGCRKANLGYKGSWTRYVHVLLVPILTCAYFICAGVDVLPCFLISKSFLSNVVVFLRLML